MFLFVGQSLPLSTIHQPCQFEHQLVVSHWCLSLYYQPHHATLYKKERFKKKRDALKQILTQKLTIIEEDVYQENPHIEYAPEIGEESEEAPPEEDLE